MASIEKRGNKFRVKVRHQGLPELSLTFPTYEEALEWIEDHEQDYIERPEVYQKWLKLNRDSLRMNALLHVHIPLEEF